MEEVEKLRERLRDRIANQRGLQSTELDELTLAALQRVERERADERKLWNDAERRLIDEKWAKQHYVDQVKALRKALEEISRMRLSLDNSINSASITFARQIASEALSAQAEEHSPACQCQRCVPSPFAGPWNAPAQAEESSASPWRDMASAPRDGSYILAMVGGASDRWEHLNGRAFVIRHEGKTPSNFDLGWSVYPGFGGAGDDWFTGWSPLPPAEARSQQRPRHTWVSVQHDPDESIVSFAFNTKDEAEQFFLWALANEPLPTPPKA